MEDSGPPKRIPLQRGRSNFLTRTATDNAAQLARRYSLPPTAEEDNSRATQLSGLSDSPYEPRSNASEALPYSNSLSKRISNWFSGSDGKAKERRRRRRSRSRSHARVLGDSSLTAQMLRQNKDLIDKPSLPKVGSLPRPIGGTDKMDTFSGVFVPTSLNVLSILMFIRFGFVLGQSGVVGMMGMLVACYLINLVTTMSISAIASNGTVRGGGAYYLISRSLGPEFGGSIGVVFYMGFVFNTGMNAVGLIDCLNQNFGSVDGNWANFLRDGFWWQYLWATIVMLLCTAICLAGSAIFARCSNGLLLILLVATLSIPVSTLFVHPFINPHQKLEYTGLSTNTLLENFLPKFTKGAAGSQLPGKENYQDLFGILFPATGGIFAGASMSGDLKNPSRSIPKGTLYGLLLTFFSYSLVIFAMGASITRGSFYRNVNVLQDVNLSATLILAGECATCLFSALMGVIGPAKLLQAIARDNLLPGLSIFGQGTKKKDEPTYAILVTFVVAQLTMLCDVNQIASFITMTYLMTFLVTNLACFLLKISSAPNFRPSFRYFNSWTAALGTIISGATMFFVDGLYAAGCVGILVIIFLIIHYTTPPKSWGDVSQSLIYHQVRKYLLRLKQEHVKFWRPQILLFINDPRHQYKLIQFCNSLKKGALFILGHVIVTEDFGGAVPEARRQQAAWAKYIDFSRIKAFVNIAISPGLEWGSRNIVLSAGLGGMRPNIVVMGFYNLDQLRRDQPLVDVPSPPLSRPVSLTESKVQKPGKKQRRGSKADETSGLLPTDTNRVERAVGATAYITVLEDMMLRLQINVAIAKGFQDLEFPDPNGENSKRYIDLWPIQMSAEIAAEGGEHKQNVLTTNFDTYTLILQLGCILDTVPKWKKAYTLRVIVFVEYETEVEEERSRVITLLENLRIQAEVLVFWLASGDVKSYQIIVNGETANVNKDAEKDVDYVLKDEDWWQDLQNLRGKAGKVSPSEEIAHIEGLLKVAPTWPSSSFQHGRKSEGTLARFEGLKKFIRHSKRRPSISNLSSLGVSLGMRTHRLEDDVVQNHASHQSASEASDSSDESDSDSFASYSEDEQAASENDLDDFSSEQSEADAAKSLIKRVSRRRSYGDSLQYPRKISQRYPSKKTVTENRIPKITTTATVSEPDLIDMPGSSSLAVQSDHEHSAVSSESESVDGLQTRPHGTWHSSAPKFNSSTIPKTRIATDDSGGPSIMFTEPALAATPKDKDQSIYTRLESSPPKQGEDQQGTQASGYPLQQSIPLSFNDLPCRAQHLILNDLMQNQCADTAVIFTTLPPPVEGTHRSEQDSVSYLSDLEVLCQGLPPVLLVHSNSMTVTMSL